VNNSRHTIFVFWLLACLQVEPTNDTQQYSLATIADNRKKKLSVNAATKQMLLTMEGAA